MLGDSSAELLAATFEPAELDRMAMDFYMRLRPNVPRAQEGWGRAGRLGTNRIDALIEERCGRLSAVGSDS
jgi:hypothetical protein